MVPHERRWRHRIEIGRFFFSRSSYVDNCNFPVDGERGDRLKKMKAENMYAQMRLWIPKLHHNIIMNVFANPRE